MTVVEARSKMKTLVSEIRTLAAKASDDAQTWTGDDEKRWNELNADYDRAKVVADSGAFGDEDRGFGLEDRVGNDGTKPVRHATPTAECLRDARTGRLVPVYGPGESMRSAFTTNEYDGLTAGDMLRALACGASSDMERRALSEGTDSAGGYTVPAILSAQMIDLMRKKARVTQAGARSITVDSNRHAFAKLLTDPTPAWRGELASVGTGDPTFGEVVFEPKSLAVLVRVSEELLQDSINAGTALQTAIANALALEVDRACLFGTGASNQPTGLFTTSGINSVSMGTNGAAIDDYAPVLDACEDILEDNGELPTAAIMAPRTWRVFAGLADSTGQPLRRPEAIANLPFLESTQVPINQTQGTATDASCVLLGDFSQMVLGYRQTLRVEVLKERFRDTLEIGFLAHLRFDMQVWQAGAFAKIVGVIPG